MALQAIVGAWIGPGGAPQQRNPQAFGLARHPLGAIEQQRHVAKAARGHRGNPTDGRHLPAGLLPGVASDGRALDHAARGIRCPTAGRLGQGHLQAQQLMALLPAHLQHQFERGAARQQPPLKPHRTATAAAPPDKTGAQRSPFAPLRSAAPAPGQGVVPVVGRQVPGIPELALIAPTAPLQGTRQQLPSLAIPEALHPSGADAGAHQTVVESPTGTVGGVAVPQHLHRILNWPSGPRLARAPAQKPEALDAGEGGKLQPLAAPRGVLAGQRGFLVPKGPGAGRQAQGAGRGAEGLQLHHRPGLAARDRPWGGTEGTSQGQVPLAAGAAAGGTPLGFGLVVHLGDGRTRQDVVELLEQQRAPIDGFRGR